MDINKSPELSSSKKNTVLSERVAKTPRLVLNESELPVVSSSPTLMDTGSTPSDSRTSKAGLSESEFEPFLSNYESTTSTLLHQ